MMIFGLTVNQLVVYFFHTESFATNGNCPARDCPTRDRAINGNMHSPAKKTYAAGYLPYIILYIYICGQIYIYMII